MVVRSKYSAMGWSSKPITEMSAGYPQADLPQGPQGAESHLIRSAKMAVGQRGAEQLDRSLVPAPNSEVAVHLQARSAGIPAAAKAAR